MRNLSSWSIRNPVPTIVLFIALMIAGIAGYTTLRINNVPDLEIPAIVVTVAQPGAAPSSSFLAPTPTGQPMTSATRSPTSALTCRRMSRSR